MAVDLNGLALVTPARSAEPAATPSTLGQIDEIAQEFEALVLAQLLAPIFAGVENNPLVGGGPGEDAFEAMLQEHYADAFAARGGVGIADQVKASLIAMQADNTPAALR